MNNNWEEEFYQKFGHIQIIKDDKNGNSYDRITDFISALLKEREAEIRKEREDYIKDLEKSIEILQTKAKLDKEYFEKIRKEAIEDYLKSEEGKVYQDYQTMKKQAENDVRKETIKAVLPEEKDMPVADENFFIGYNTCRELIKDKAKEKFNITI